MTLKRVTVYVDHTFELDIPEDILNGPDDWALDYFVYDAFDDEDWEFSGIDIDDIR